MNRTKTFAGAFFAFTALAAIPASAIECDGNFQVQRAGNLIATPYCADQHLAEVAEEYGAEVSAASIRNNPSYKQRVCRLVGYDNRVRDTCSAYRNERNRGRYFWP